MVRRPCHGGKTVSDKRQRLFGIRIRFVVGFGVGILYIIYSVTYAAANGAQNVWGLVLGGLVMLAAGSVGVFLTSWYIDRRKRQP